jgi:hypothetical protein
VSDLRRVAFPTDENDAVNLTGCISSFSHLN